MVVTFEEDLRKHEQSYNQTQKQFCDPFRREKVRRMKLLTREVVSSFKTRQKAPYPIYVYNYRENTKEWGRSVSHYKRSGSGWIGSTSDSEGFEIVYVITSAGDVYTHGRLFLTGVDQKTKGPHKDKGLPKHGPYITSEEHELVSEDTPPSWPIDLMDRIKEVSYDIILNTRIQ